jgi:hypothetical protein
MPTIQLANLSTLTFDPARRAWRGEVALASGRTVPLAICVDEPAFAHDPEWVRTLVRRVNWVCVNEPSLRGSVADRMYDGWRSDWYDEEIDTVNSKPQFVDSLRLDGINVYEDPFPELIYHDGNLFGGHAVVVSVADDGALRWDPTLFG